MRKEWWIETRGRGLSRIDPLVTAWLLESGAGEGIAQLFLHHTSASLIVCENADPAVLSDLEAFFARLVRDGDPLFRHDQEGPDDMPAHVRSVLTGCSVAVPVSEGRLDLGTWQGIYLWEHRRLAHRRRLSAVFLRA
jgi:secondary thiamine-phosphate synthase enzyme